MKFDHAQPLAFLAEEPPQASAGWAVDLAARITIPACHDHVGALGLADQAFAAAVGAHGGTSTAARGARKFAMTVTLGTNHLGKHLFSPP